MHPASGRLLSTFLVLVLLGAIAGAASFSAFSGQSDNQGTTFAAGTVQVSDDDSGTAMFNLTGAKPGTIIQKCLKVTYGGSLSAQVRLFSDSTIGALGPYLNLTITPGSGGSFGDCVGFAPDAGGALFDGTLEGFRNTHSSWTSGLATGGDHPGQRHRDRPPGPPSRAGARGHRLPVLRRYRELGNGAARASG